MSAILIRREMHVTVTAVVAAKEFADAPADIQADFLVGMVDAVGDWTPPHSWPMQCRHITDEMLHAERNAVASLLETLVEHLREART